MTMSEWIVVGLVFVAGIVFGVIATKKRHLVTRQRQLDEARLLFHRMREQLEAKFLQRAALSGKPRGLRWADCEFEHDVAYARDRQSGQLCALVAVSIKFEAVPGGGMEEVEAVNNAKFGTAIFHYDAKHQWIPDGRPIFNLNPSEAVLRFQDTLEPVGLTDD
jgi:hypothetical protein